LPRFASTQAARRPSRLPSRKSEPLPVTVGGSFHFALPDFLLLQFDAAMSSPPQIIFSSARE
jgi:hypothetical protein